MNIWAKWAKYYGKCLGNLPSSTGWLMTEAHIWAFCPRRPWNSYLSFMWIEAHIWAFCPRRPWSSYLSFMWIEAHIWAFCPRRPWSSYLSFMWIEAHIWAFCPRRPFFLLLTAPTFLRHYLAKLGWVPFADLRLRSLAMKWNAEFTEGGWKRTSHFQFEAVCGPKFMSFWGDVGDPL